VSEKTALRVISRSSPQGHRCRASPLAEGRAPHARNLGITLTQMLSPFGYRLIVKPPMATQCVGIRTAVPCGRGDRAPPRKPPSALSPGFSARPSVLGSPPRRGGLCTPAREGIGLTKAWVLLATGLS